MKITGQIFDENMKFLGNANVEVVGENRNTSADGDGYFEIEVNSINSQLKFTHATKDYDTISVAEFQNNGYYWQLLPSTLEEVEVIGKPKQKSDNTAVIILGIIAFAIIIKVASKPKPVKVKI